MANYKVTFFYEGHQTGIIGAGSSVGWTESWYKTMDKRVDEAILDEDITNYVNLRLQTLSNIYRMSFVRVNDEDIPRRFKLASLNNALGQVHPEESDTDLAQVQCAILIDLEKLPASTGPDVGVEQVHHRRFLMRGLPSSIINGNVLNSTSPLWIKFKTFFDFIGNHETRGFRDKKNPIFSWGIRYEDPSVLRFRIKKAIVAPANNRTLLTIEDGAMAPLLNQKFTIRAVDSPERFNKVWTFMGDTVIGADTYHTWGTARRRLQGEYTGPGPAYIFLNKFKYGPVDQYAIIGLRSKRTGRVFRQLRGRSSRR